MILELQRPSAPLCGSYASLVSEFETAGDPFVPFPLGYRYRDFTELLTRFAHDAAGIGVPADWVPHSTFWLVANGTEVVAVSNLRHRLADRLEQVGGHIGYGVRPSARRQGFATRVLAETLTIARRELGLERCLVTCADANIASARAIERNGGQLASRVHAAEHNGLVRRYWVPTPTFA